MQPVVLVDVQVAYPGVKALKVVSEKFPPMGYDPPPLTGS